MNKRIIAASIVGIGLVLTGTAYAKSSLGMVKMPNGTEVPKVGISGTISGTSTTGKNQVQVKEADGKVYNVNLGPRWYANTQVTAGESVKVEGIERTDSQISAWKLTRADGSEVSIRTQAGKPAWAGQRGAGQGHGMGQGQGFVDKNGDGICDNMQ